VLVTAAEGGTVEVSGSETRLVIPPAALTADTEISVSFGRLDDFAPLDNARDRVLVMAPEGTVLSRSASLTFDPGEPALGGFEYVTIRQYVDGGWYPPEQSSAEIGSGGLVAASIDLLAPTALVVLEADGG
jgi:hypothetical protein